MDYVARRLHIGEVWMKFDERVAAFLARHPFTPSQFGRATMGDPNFVPRLRKGRQVTERVMLKVDKWMADQTDAEITRMAGEGVSWGRIASKLGLSLSHVRRRAKELGLPAKPKP
jgi:hypothetical protein